MDDFLGLNPARNIHSYSELIKQEACGNCYCCLAESNLKSMLSTYYFEGKAEVYSEMMIYCFSIELLSDSSENIGIESVYQICETCICRLREACFFKNKIETTQESLRKISDFAERNHDLKEETYENNADTDFFKAVVSLDSLKSENTDEEFNSNVVKKKVKKKKYSKEKKNTKKRKLENNVITNLKNYKSFQKFNCLTDASVEKLNVIENVQNSENSPVKRNKADKSSYKLSKDAVTCKICNETFPLHNALVRHMPIHFPNHICHICAKVYESNIKLICHIRRHEQPKHVCDICHKSYKGLDNLKNHMRQHSKPSSVYKCPLCPERFSVYYKRVKHLVNVHNDEPKKYKCKQCPKRYFQSCTLKSHIKRVHLQERSCVCSECGDAFYDKSGLTEHMLKHTGIKNFQCDICQKSYARRYTLNEHMRIHTNDKRFVCSFCGRAFTQKCTLKGHLKTHEKQQASSE